jgi:hypothetical protein
MNLCEFVDCGGEVERAEFRNGIVPEWEGVNGLSFVEDFRGFGLRRSSILGIGVCERMR